MVNRLQHLLGEIPEATSYTDFYELEALGNTFTIALSTALSIVGDRSSDRLEFQDIFGVRHRLPVRCAYRITESTLTRKEYE
jgi:hypothetical protein